VRRLALWAALVVVASADAAPLVAASADTAAPRPVKERLIYVGGPDDPVEVVFTTNVPLERIQHGSKIVGGIGVESNPSLTLHSLGSCDMGYAPSSVASRLKPGRRYTVSIALGRGDAEQRYERKVTLKRMTEAGLARTLGC
jgi:hypothetical protein